MIDRNGNGLISKDELLAGYLEMYGGSMTQDQITKQVDVLWDQVDVDGNGDIDYTEWALATANKEALLTEKRLLQAFTLFDQDHSGFITAKELMEVIDPAADSKTSLQDWKRIIKDIDENGDGQISFEEFKHLMTEILLGNPETTKLIDERKPVEKESWEQEIDDPLEKESWDSFPNVSIPPQSVPATARTTA